MAVLTRRAALLGALFAGTAALGLPLASRGIEEELRDILRRSFGAQVAASPEAEPFIAEVAGFWRQVHSPTQQVLRPKYWALARWYGGARDERRVLEGNVVELFLRATNYVRHEEVGEELVYIGLPNPYESACSNPLSAQWL